MKGHKKDPKIAVNKEQLFLLLPKQLKMKLQNLESFVLEWSMYGYLSNCLCHSDVLIKF